MQNAIKLLPILLLGSALGGCSMAGTGDYMADEYSQLQQYHYGGQNGCAPSPCGPQSYYPTASNPYQSNPYHGGPTTPAPYAYGQSVQGHHGYVPSAYGPAPYGLRGAPQKFEKHAYGTLGVVNYEAGEDLYGVQARAGYQFSKYFGAEAEGSFGLSKNKESFLVGTTNIDQTIGIENSIAGFGVLRYPLAGKISGYSRVGYHQTEIDQKVSSAGITPIRNEFSVNGLAYGSGLEYAINPRTAVRLDYTVYDYDGPDADSVSLAVSRKF